MKTRSCATAVLDKAVIMQSKPAIVEPSQDGDEDGKTDPGTNRAIKDVESGKDRHPGKSINRIGFRNITAVPVYNKIEPSLGETMTIHICLHRKDKQVQSFFSLSIYLYE
ncbi:hypothetical protein MTR_2g020675 [Medicago truncatula]|uniref:Uncharacterized protein n=1 Tax=Medicago truncatula TaxID=3880 RepID=A0A072V4G1_MEDTR|nr:hypothetical protein MTR_2g020675 [Medicago truncatula]